MKLIFRISMLFFCIFWTGVSLAQGHYGDTALLCALTLTNLEVFCYEILA